MTGKDIADAACDLRGANEGGERDGCCSAVTQGLEKGHDVRRDRREDETVKRDNGGESGDRVDAVWPG